MTYDNGDTVFYAPRGFDPRSRLDEAALDTEIGRDWVACPGCGALTYEGDAVDVCRECGCRPSMIGGWQ